MKRASIFKAAALLGFFSLISRLIGVYREHLLANTFGALKGEGVYNLDSYYAAFRIPDLLFNLVVLGAVSAAFVPIFADYIQRKQLNKAMEYANCVLTMLVVMIVVGSGLILGLAPLLMQVLAPGLTVEAQELATNLTRIMLISPLFFGISSVFQGIQNVYQRFFFVSVAPIFYNLGIIAGIIFGADKYGVYGVAAGVILGAFLHLLIQVPQIVRLGYRFRLLFDWKRSDMRQTFQLMLPRIAAVGASQFSLIINTMLASLFTGGSIAILNFASNLQSLPMGVVGISFSIAIFGVLSGFAANQNWRGFGNSLKHTIDSVLILIIPAAAGLFLLKYEVTSLILKGGKFELKDTILTADLLGIYMLGLIAAAIIPVLVRAFYAMQDTRTPLKAGLIAISVQLFFSIILIFGFRLELTALVFAEVISTNIALIWLLIKIQRRLKMAILEGELFFKVLVAAILMIVFGLVLKAGFVMMFGRPREFNEFLLEVSAITIVLLVFYGILLRIFGVPLKFQESLASNEFLP